MPQDEAEAPKLARIVIVIDPAATSGEDSDETGIVVVGKDNQGQGYVSADASGRVSTDRMEKNHHRRVSAHHADRIVAEWNNGGTMVEVTFMVDNNAPVTSVWASRRRCARRTGLGVA
jgi:phage terminase large subunit-like protein